MLFLVDDLGWTDLACFGSGYYQTPNIDRLASEGIRFTQGYSACTVCSPTRASIMTGKYPARIKCTDWIRGHHHPNARFSPPDWNMFMDLSEYNLADALREAGYSTIHIGKWHLGEEENYWPENRGFDINIGGWRVGAPQLRGDSCNGYFSPYCNPRLEDGPEGEYLTERLADEAVKYIESRKGKKEPFFLNFWFYNVHTPLQAREEKIKKFEALSGNSTEHSNPVYAAMIEHTDEAIGKVMKTLKEAGFDNNTIILFTSDNGGLCAMHRDTGKPITSNSPLRSGKGDIYEGGVRVPFIFRWNKKIKPNTVNDTPIISCDLYPTLLGLTKTPGNPGQNSLMDGKDLSRLLLHDEELTRDALYWHYPHYHTQGARPYSAIRKGNWKLIEVFEYDSLMLYNLENDISEQVNLASAHPEKVRELLDNLNRWRAEVEAQMPVENPHYKEVK